MEVDVVDKYDKYTLIGALAFSNEEYENLNEKWYEWINSENGKDWIKREVPECEDFIMDGWVIMVDSEEIGFNLSLFIFFFVLESLRSLIMNKKFNLL